MKKRKTGLLIIGSALLLVALLLVQGLWIYRSATIKEEQFSQQVSIALCKTAEAICADDMTCRSFGSCCMMKENSSCKLELNEIQKARVDSLLRSYMEFYNVPLDYHFEIVRDEQSPFIPVSSDARLFQQKLNAPGLEKGYRLRIQLPEKSNFIRAEMGPLFIISALLILGLITLFAMTLRALAQDRRVLKRTTDFVNNMVHEFRTPLTNISLATNMIERNDITADKKNRFSGIIRSESDRLKSEVERLLLLAELEKGEAKMELKNIDLRKLIHELVHVMEVQANAKEGKIEINDEAKNVAVQGDDSMLVNAFRNLIDNGIKYAKKNPELKIHLWNEGKNLFISVSDNGIGIDEAEQKMIFDRFYRVSNGDVHDVKGFGLGLAYVKKVIDLHRGEINLKSELGRGSTFTIRLPLE